MKAIHYDTEADILSVTFSEPKAQKHLGLELMDNIVFYYNTETRKPLKLLILSYQALLRFSIKKPILLDRLTLAPTEMQITVADLLKREPMTTFIQIVDENEGIPVSCQLNEIFTSNTLQTVAAS